MNAELVLLMSCWHEGKSGRASRLQRLRALVKQDVRELPKPPCLG